MTWTEPVFLHGHVLLEDAATVAQVSTGATGGTNMFDLRSNANAVFPTDTGAEHIVFDRGAAGSEITGLAFAAGHNLIDIPMRLMTSNVSAAGDGGGLYDTVETFTGVSGAFLSPVNEGTVAQRSARWVRLNIDQHPPISSYSISELVLGTLFAPTRGPDPTRPWGRDWLNNERRVQLRSGLEGAIALGPQRAHWGPFRYRNLIDTDLTGMEAMLQAGTEKPLFFSPPRATGTVRSAVWVRHAREPILREDSFVPKSTDDRGVAELELLEYLG